MDIRFVAIDLSGESVTSQLEVDSLADQRFILASCACLLQTRKLFLSDKEAKKTAEDMRDLSAETGFDPMNFDVTAYWFLHLLSEPESEWLQLAENPADSVMYVDGERYMPDALETLEALETTVPSWAPHKPLIERKTMVPMRVMGSSQPVTARYVRALIPWKDGGTQQMVFDRTTVKAQALNTLETVCFLDVDLSLPVKPETLEALQMAFSSRVFPDTASVTRFLEALEFFIPSRKNRDLTLTSHITMSPVSLDGTSEPIVFSNEPTWFHL